MKIYVVYSICITVLDFRKEMTATQDYKILLNVLKIPSISKVNVLHAMAAYSSLDATKIKYNIRRLSKDEKNFPQFAIPQHLLILLYTYHTITIT
jgi:uncharacterized protein (DUF39 family)